jgi:hypothetical protein
MGKQSKKTTGADEKNLRSLFDLALFLREDGRRVSRLREKLGLTKTQLAKRSHIILAKVTAYLRSGRSVRLLSENR